MAPSGWGAGETNASRARRVRDPVTGRPRGRPAAPAPGSPRAGASPRAPVPGDVVAPRSDGAARRQVPGGARGRARRARAHQRGLGRLLAGAMRFLGELSQARNDGIDIERASATWSTSFTSYHGQLLAGRAVGVAIEIERAVTRRARASAESYRCAAAHSSP